MAGLKPTAEQLEAVEQFMTGRPLKIAAFAGAGKTSTLHMLASSRKSRGVYLAFNKSIAAEAKERFPGSVDCRTTHSIAFRAIMPLFESKSKMMDSLQAKQLAKLLGYKDRIFPGSIRLNDVHQAHLVLGTVRRYCQGSDPSPLLRHVPTYGRLLGATEGVLAEVQEWAVGEAIRLWGRMSDRRDQIPLGHDGYLKLWGLSRPTLSADYVLLDEAQDTNGVVLGVLADQEAQLVYVGDRHQQIYEWRGAINAMESIRNCLQSNLTQSFRFGDAIAAGASNVLATLGETMKIRGNPNVSSSIVAFGRAQTVLARTNATVILEVLEAMDQNLKPAVVGGTKDLERLLSDVYELKKGKPGISSEFVGFEDWSEVVAFADTEEGEGIRTFVQLVEQHGEGKLWAAVKSASADENGADVILSTAHKAKGREWDSVRLASDFGNSRLGSNLEAAAEVRLFYVAMTRARKSLIVAPELLTTFATDAWKSKENAGRAARAFTRARGGSEPPSRARPTAVPEPRYSPGPPSGDFRELNESGVRNRHPAAAPEAASARSARPSLASSQAQPQTSPRSGSLPRPAIREINESGVRAKHPAVAPEPPKLTKTTPESAGRESFWWPDPPPPRPNTPEKGFWGRLAGLFK